METYQKTSNKQLNLSKTVSNSNISNNGINNDNINTLVSDFDHVDSWGIPHEASTDFGYNCNLECGDRSMDSNHLNNDQCQRNVDHDNDFIGHTQHLLKDDVLQIPNHLVSCKYNSNGKSPKKN